MPDYDRTLIYKLACKDPNFKNFFIGATCNFAGQKWKHHNITTDHTEKKDISGHFMNAFAEQAVGKIGK